MSDLPDACDCDAIAAAIEDHRPHIHHAVDRELDTMMRNVMRVCRRHDSTPGFAPGALSLLDPYDSTYRVTPGGGQPMAQDGTEYIIDAITSGHWVPGALTVPGPYWDGPPGSLGFDSGMQLTSPTITAIPQPLTIHTLVHLQAGFGNVGNAQILGDRTDPQATIFVFNNNWAAYAGAVFDTGVPADTDWHVLSVVFNGASSEFFVDGVSIGTGNPGSDGIPTTGMIIGTSGTIHYIKGNIGHLSVYGTVQDGATIAAQSAFVRSHAGV